MGQEKVEHHAFAGKSVEHRYRAFSRITTSKKLRFKWHHILHQISMNQNVVDITVEV